MVYCTEGKYPQKIDEKTKDYKETSANVSN